MKPEIATNCPTKEAVPMHDLIHARRAFERWLYGRPLPMATANQAMRCEAALKALTLGLPHLNPQFMATVLDDLRELERMLGRS
jgi:hypothetical protein